MEGKIRFLAVAFVLCCLSGVASADKTIAHSQSLGMSFIAKGEPWCQKQVQVQIEGNDASKFSTDAFKTIIKKLGKVLVEECPAVKMFEIVAHVDRGLSGVARRRKLTDGPWCQPCKIAFPCLRGTRFRKGVVTHLMTEPLLELRIQMGDAPARVIPSQARKSQGQRANFLLNNLTMSRPTVSFRQLLDVLHV